MKNVTMIAAVGRNLELGYDNHLIWHLKDDLNFFREQTINKPVVMGRKTLESLPKLLPKRKHIVLTRHNLPLPEEVILVHSIEELLKYIENTKEEVMIIGGASIYNEMLDYSEKLILTEIDAEYKKADSYFPKFNKEEWESEIIKDNMENNVFYTHKIYKKKKM